MRILYIASGMGWRERKWSVSMTWEEQLKMEIRKIEKEISILDQELEKYHVNILKILTVKKKKEQDLKTLRANFETPEDEKDFQISLAKLLKEGSA